MSNWDASLYDQKHGFVTTLGQGVLELLAPAPGERIVDLGCGTGHLTAKIAESGATAVGVDADANMIASAQASYPGMEFVCADAAEYRSATPFDAAFSNAAFHWMMHLPEVFLNTASLLRPGGRLVFEMGGKGNVEITLGSLLRAVEERTGSVPSFPKNYLSIGEVSAMLEEAGFEVSMAAHFDRPTPLDGVDGYRNWLRQFGVQLLSPLTHEEQEDLLARAQEMAAPELLKDGVWVADYRRLRVVAHLIR